MDRTRTLTFLRLLDDRGPLRRTHSAVGPAALSEEGVGGFDAVAEGDRRAVPGAAPSSAIGPARPRAAKRQGERAPTPIHGAFAIDRIGAVRRTRSARTVAPGNRNRFWLSMALATAFALGGSAGPGRAEPTGDAGQVLVLYGRMYEALVTDRTEGVAESAAELGELAGACAKSGDGADACGALATAAKRIGGRDLETLRAQFKELSVAVDGYLRAVEAPGWDLYYCPMADGYWIQTAEGVRNPYYGASMLKCGDKVAGPAELE